MNTILPFSEFAEESCCGCEVCLSDCGMLEGFIPDLGDWVAPSEDERTTITKFGAIL